MKRNISALFGITVALCVFQQHTSFAQSEGKMILLFKIRPVLGLHYAELKVCLYAYPLSKYQYIYLWLMRPVVEAFRQRSWGKNARTQQERPTILEKKLMGKK